VMGEEREGCLWEGRRAVGFGFSCFVREGAGGSGRRTLTVEREALVARERERKEKRGEKAHLSPRIAPDKQTLSTHNPGSRPVLSSRAHQTPMEWTPSDSTSASSRLQQFVARRQPTLPTFSPNIILILCILPVDDRCGTRRREGGKASSWEGVEKR
jgi:hypothetical protein